MSKKYCTVWDAIYLYDEWVEKTCDDINCIYCRNRPNKHPRNCPCKKKNDILQKQYTTGH
jgi:hypothetical protein